MNGSLREKLIPKQWRVFRVDSLYRAYKKPFLLLTLYGSTGIQTKNAFVGYAKNVADKLIMIEEGEESSLALRPRIKSSFNDFSVFSLMLLIGFVATLFGGYERPFRRMYSVLDLFTFDSRSDTFMVNKPFSRTNFLFLILNCGLIAYLYFFASNNSYNLFFSNQLINENQTFSQTLLPFLEITAILMALMLAKYTLLYLLGQLYKIGSITNLHFFRDIQSSVLFYSVVVILVSLISMYIPRWNQVEIKYIFIYPAITFYILRTLLLYFTISTNSDTKNLYLISYLCISEFIPLIIGVRYVL